ncbi:MAG: U-box domain [Gammaproteobacteria bacterium]|jgi:hypothetical protein|nr:U-box domain [Gammaproteobacteria bacterium]
MLSNNSLFKTRPIKQDIHEIILFSSKQLAIPLPEKYADYRCSISLLMMFDPATSNCHHHFERTEIEKWRAPLGEPLQGEEKEAEPSVFSCPCCRAPITTLLSDRPLRSEITQFLKTTKNQLEKAIEDNPADHANNLTRQNIIGLTRDFLKYGNDEFALEARYRAKEREFWLHFKNGQIGEACGACSDSSEIVSQEGCRLL